MPILTIGSNPVPGVFVDKDVDLDFQNPLINDGVHKLFSRGKGIWFRLNPLCGGQLAPLSCLAKLGSWLCGGEPLDKLKNHIDYLIGHVETQLQRASDEDRPHLDRAMSQIFGKEGAVGRLAGRLLGRDRIERGSPLFSHLFGADLIRLKIGERAISFYSPEVEKGFDLRVDLREGPELHNLYRLFSRKEGERFRVVDGKLRAVFLPRSRGQMKVQVAVSQALKKLNASLSSCGKKELKRWGVVLRHFMSGLGAVARMSRSVYERGAVEEGSMLERLLDPEVERARSLFFAGKSRESFCHFLAAEWRLAELMGVRSRAGVGFDRFGNPLLACDADRPIVPYIDGCAPLRKFLGVGIGYYLMPGCVRRWYFSREALREKIFEKVPEEAIAGSGLDPLAALHVLAFPEGELLDFSRERFFQERGPQSYIASQLEAVRNEEAEMVALVQEPRWE